MTVRRHATGTPRHPAGRWVVGLVLSALFMGAVVAGAWRSPAMRTPGAAPAAASSTSPILGVAVPSAASGDTADPVTVFELADPVVRYQAQVSVGLAQLEGRLQALVTHVRAGDVGAARADWLAAHLAYHRLGAAYGAFGPAARAIDGLPHGLPRGPADPAFTGLHAVERLLWASPLVPAASPAPPVPPAVTALATRLLADVRALRARADTLDISPNAFTARAHEILEDALQVQLTGSDDEGSGTGLATVAAELEGTRAVVALLRPVIERRRPGLPGRIDAALDGVDAAVGHALETLAPVPGLLSVEEDDDD